MVPVVWSLVYSFFKGSPALGFQFVGLTNYRHRWTDATIRQTLLFTIKYAVVSSTLIRTEGSAQLDLISRIRNLDTAALRSWVVLARMWSLVPVIYDHAP